MAADGPDKPPGPIKDLRVEIVDGKPRLTWTAAPGASYQRIERRRVRPAGEAQPSQPGPELPRTLLRSTILEVGGKTPEGELIIAVASPWYDLLNYIVQNPESAHQVGHRKFEEIVAGAYVRAGFDVTLTPSSGDHGIDVIAAKELGSAGYIRIIDQVKAYKPDHIVKTADVREFGFVLTNNPGATKGFVTTTSSFAPGTYTDPYVAPLIPYRLELRSGPQLLEWLKVLRQDDG